MQSAVDWIPEKAAWFLSSNMSQGAVMIDADGIQELVIDESTALPVA
jgi:hypothetical protein